MLKNFQILITRPKHQAEKLTTIIKKQGGSPISFPTLEIKTLNKNNFLSYLKDIKNYNFIVFLSTNAVLATAKYIIEFYPIWPKKIKVIAIGASTANALKQAGLPVSYYPKKKFSSEDLLGLSALQNLKDKRILILQGEKGRRYLDKKLEKKGAKVTTVDTYKRICPFADKMCIPNPVSVNVIVCTSNNGLKNLVTLLHPHWDDSLFEKQLLVISPRIAAYAKKLGFVKLPLISDNANDTAILQILLAYVKKTLKRNST